MQTLLLIAFPVFGSIVGSFLGVITTRLNTGMSFGGRSMCLSCRQVLRWYELIPIISFLIQRGRCRVCHCRIPKRDFIIEIVTALLFFGIGATYGIQALANPFLWISILFMLIIVSLLVVISLYDLQHMIVPDSMSVPFIVLSFLSIFVVRPETSFLIQQNILTPTWQHALAGIIIPLPFLIIWLASKGRLMGFGDIKLMVGIGWLLGLFFAFSAIIYAFWIGAIVSLVILAGQRMPRLFGGKNRFIMSSEVPFAPFLAIGTYVVLICRWDLLAIPFL